jgi:hypothetical protein
VFFKEMDDGVESLFVIYRYEGIADGLSAGHERVGWIGKGKKKAKAEAKAKALFAACRQKRFNGLLHGDLDFDLWYADLSQLKPNIVFFIEP